MNPDDAILLCRSALPCAIPYFTAYSESLLVSGVIQGVSCAILASCATPITPLAAHAEEAADRADGLAFARAAVTVTARRRPEDAQTVSAAMTIVDADTPARS